MSNQAEQSNVGKIYVTRGPGGLPGLDVHAGAWLALEHLGIYPDHVMGCSAGAVASAFQAAGYDANDYIDILWSLRDKDIVRKRLAWQARAFWITHFLNNRPLIKLLQKYLPQTFEECQLPLCVSATEMSPLGEHSIHFSQGDNLPAKVLASTSIAGAWPYVAIDGNNYSDGGTTDAIVEPPILTQDDILIVLSPYRSTPYSRRDRNMISRLMWNVDQLADFECNAALRRLGRLKNVYWFNLNMGAGSTFHFNHDLIGQTFEAVTQQAVQCGLPVHLNRRKIA